jgi:hypothetical protein
MNTNVLQTLRYKLQKRLKRVNTADFQIYHGIIVQTFRFLRENPVVRGILDDLERRVPSADGDSERLFNAELLTGENETEHIALCYGLLKRVAAADGDPEMRLGCRFGHKSKFPEGVETFTELFVEPLFDYIDEQIDDRRSVIGLLLKYKHHVEWFRRDELRDAYKADTHRGEKHLARHLYAFLHDQGLDFSIEPASISGEADLVSAQTGEDRLVADVKVFDPAGSKTPAYLARGFAQLYQYTQDYNDPFGYLVVFKLCREGLAVNGTGQEASLPYFNHNNKTIFVVTIDICDHPEPASKRGVLKTYELLEEELIRTVNETAQSQTQV